MYITFPGNLATGNVYLNKNVRQGCMRDSEKINFALLKRCIVID